MQKPFKITVYGAGAIGTTLAAWLTRAGHDVSLLARGENARQLQQKSIRMLSDNKVLLDDTRVRVIETLGAAEDIDLLIITVKNFHLDACCQDIVNVIGRNTLVLGLQNGVENQTILPKYFDRVVYAIINYNAWPALESEPHNNNRLNWNVSVFGPIILGTLSPSMLPVAKDLTALFSSFIRCEFSQSFQDHAHAKLVNNLANSVTTIIGNSHREESALKPLQAVLTQLTNEGINTLQAAGIKETKAGPLPPWNVIRLIKRLPAILTRFIFRRKMAIVGSTSMANDIIARGAGESELDSINGYLLKLADKHGVDVPYSQGLYQLCQQRFNEEPFRPMSAHELRIFLDDYAQG
jgi:2-dehydropantoate 2-reductase